MGFKQPAEFGLVILCRADSLLGLLAQRGEFAAGGLAQGAQLSGGRFERAGACGIRLTQIGDLAFQLRDQGYALRQLRGVVDKPRAFGIDLGVGLRQGCVGAARDIKFACCGQQVCLAAAINARQCADQPEHKQAGEEPGAEPGERAGKVENRRHWNKLLELTERRARSRQLSR